MQTIKISKALDPNELLDLKEQLLVSVETAKTITFDVTQLENISTPLIQFFIAFQKTGVDIKFKHTAGPFLELLQDFGCEQAFEGALV